MLKQLSIFAENIKGKMQRVTGILLEEDINILGSVTNDSAEYGIIRMVVSKPEQALEALTKAGFICKLSDVLGIEVKDEVGNLNKTASVSEAKVIKALDYLSVFNVTDFHHGSHVVCEVEACCEIRDLILFLRFIKHFRQKQNLKSCIEL
ncbi:MAG: amino acid-binding protein [Ruminococcus sp.]